MDKKTPKYMEIVNWINEQIHEGKIIPGQKMYSENELSAMFGLSRQTVRHAIEVLDLPFAFKPRRWSQMMEALRNGQLVILLVNSSSVFTDGQHMLLLTGITESGRITVHDPYEPNYNRVELITGYTHGFQEKLLAEGFDGGWIFGKKQENTPLDIATPYRNFRSMDWIR